MKLGQRIKMLRLEKGWTQYDLARFLSVSEPTISYYESGKREPDISLLHKLANLFNVSLDYLLGKSNIRNPEDDINTVPIPIVGTIRAGEPILAEENIEGYEYVQAREAAGGEYFYLRVTGDSMINARIAEGDLVYVRKQPDVESGEIAVVLVNGNEATLKRVLKVNNSIILQPENPKYKPMVFTQADIESGYVQIIGKVIHSKIHF